MGRSWLPGAAAYPCVPSAYPSAYPLFPYSDLLFSSREGNWVRKVRCLECAYMGARTRVRKRPLTRANCVPPPPMGT